MATTPSITVPLLALGLLGVLSGCVRHWPDAPYLDSVDQIPPDAAPHALGFLPGAGAEDAILASGPVALYESSPSVAPGVPDPSPVSSV